MTWQGYLIATAIIAVIIKKLIDFITKIRRLPPGPWGLPFVGYLPWIQRESYLTFAEFGSKYGGLYSIQLGGQTAIILNDWPTIKATLVDNPKIFSGRPSSFISDLGIKRKTITFSDGENWNKQRRTTVQCLRNIGMGRKSMETIIKESTQQLIEDFTVLDNQVVEMDSMFYSAVIRVNWGFVTGDRASTEDAKMLKKLEKITKKVIFYGRADNVVNVFPWLRFLPPFRFGFNKYIKYDTQLVTTLKNMLIEQMSTNANGNATFIDYYMAEVKRHTNDGMTPPPYESDNTVGTLYDLFLAGGDTVNVTAQWGFLYLATYDKVQRKVQAQLDHIIGRNRLISVDDFPYLPYLDAVIKEVHQMSSIAPLSVFHCPIEDFQLKGYTIPKGTMCLQNIYAVHYDPDLWDEPHAFKPERFLDKDNKPISPPYLMPFSIGPRLCIGQSIAEMELRILFGSLLQKFSFSLPPNRPKPSFEINTGLVSNPFPYSLLVTNRN